VEKGMDHPLPKTLKPLKIVMPLLLATLLNITELHEKSYADWELDGDIKEVKLYQITAYSWTGHRLSPSSAGRHGYASATETLG